MTMLSDSAAEAWTRIPISCVEDLSDAVLGAGLEVTQLSRAPITGSLAFTTSHGITCSTGYVAGRVALTGSLSESLTTLGVGVVMAPGTRHWLNEVTSGSVGVFLPGDEHDAVYMPGSIYVAVSLGAERLEELAAKHDLVLDRQTLGGSGVHPRKFLEPTVSALEAQFRRVHAACCYTAELDPRVVRELLLRAFIMHLARPPRFHLGGTDPKGHARIVARARAFIHENLDQPLSIDMIADAAWTSLRTLNRAFQTVLGETPYSYVLKLRLHRIRHRLVSDAELAHTIKWVANRLGVHEMGRFAGWYRDLFGELPSQTLARRRRNVAIPTEAQQIGKKRIVPAR